MTKKEAPMLMLMLMLVIVIAIESEMRDGRSGEKSWNTESKEPCLLCAQADPQ